MDVGSISRRTAGNSGEHSLAVARVSNGGKTVLFQALVVAYAFEILPPDKQLASDEKT